FQKWFMRTLEAIFMREYRLFLTDIIEAIDEIEDFTSGMDFTEFLNDRKTRKAVVKNIEIIGEAAKNVPDEIKTSYPDIPWRVIAGMRDRLAHGYFGIDYVIVWDVVGNRLIGLRDSIRAILVEID
ncbi:HepT-like ribonuclease domain-containing protein, partial [Methanolobus halotolerans]